MTFREPGVSCHFVGNLLELLRPVYGEVDFPWTFRLRMRRTGLFSSAGIACRPG